jgi:hypothetical protein
MYICMYVYIDTEERLYSYRNIYRYTPREAAAANQIGGKAVAYLIKFSVTGNLTQKSSLPL